MGNQEFLNQFKDKTIKEITPNERNGEEFLLIRFTDNSSLTIDATSGHGLGGLIYS